MGFNNRRRNSYGDRGNGRGSDRDRDQDDNRGVLFQNDHKESDKHPDFKGRIRVDGRDYWISGWEKRSKGGDDYISLAVTRQDEERRGSRSRGRDYRDRDGDDRREVSRSDDRRDRNRDRDKDRGRDDDRQEGSRRKWDEQGPDDEIPF